MMVSKREQLIEAAMALFQERGFRATGIDAILSRAGVAKMTLYKHFGSKDDLVFAAIRRADEQWRHWFTQEIERRASDPRGRLIAVFEIAGDWIRRPDFQGCMFARAAGEFTDQDAPVRSACAEHNKLLTRLLRGFAQDAGAADPDALAGQLAILFLGTITSAQANGASDPACIACDAARTLIDSQIGAKNTV